MTTITATSFKARCLSLMDEVAESGGELTITKRGRPVARLVPAEEEASLAGSVEFIASEEELLAPVGDGWDAEQPGIPGP